MAKIEPFNGVRYDLDKISSIVDVLAPPYDVISPEDQDALYAKSDHNVVRLILGKQSESDTESDNRYTRAAGVLKDWLADGMIKPDDKPAIYIYAQDYEVAGEKLRRVGFITRRLIEKLGEGVFPHERTLSGPKTDRLNLTRACRMNFSQVFGLYSDPEGVLDAKWEEIMKTTADISVKDSDGFAHHMWTVTDGDIISKTQKFLEDKPVVIADGHHRYETALNYKNERRASDESDTGADYVMMYLSNTGGQGFTVLPTHRIATNIDPVNKDELVGRLAECFEISEAPFDSVDVQKAFLEELKKAGEKTPSFGMYAGGGVINLLTLKDEAHLLADENDKAEKLVKRLDVTILQELIFEKFLGISREAVASKKNVKYTISESEAVKDVDGGVGQVAFILNKTDIEQVLEVATSGGIMPQKSTYFYPKLISGLVFNPL